MPPTVYVVEGDTVRFDFDHAAEERRHVTGKVLEVRQRYEHYNHGTTKAGPLLRYVNLATGDISSASVSFVVELLDRPKGHVRRRVNIFATHHHRLPIGRPRRGVVEGFTLDLVIYYLGRLQQELTMPVNEERVLALFKKQTPGFIKQAYYPGCVQVHVKPFKAWVRRNASRFLMTTAELDARNTAFNNEQDEAYWAEWEARWDREDAGDSLGEPDPTALAAQEMD